MEKLARFLFKFYKNLLETNNNIHCYLFQDEKILHKSYAGSEEECFMINRSKPHGESKKIIAERRTVIPFHSASTILDRSGKNGSIY